MQDSSTFRPQTTPGLERGSVLIHRANGRLLGENHRCRHPLQGVVGGGVGPLLVAGGPGEGGLLAGHRGCDRRGQGLQLSVHHQGEIIPAQLGSNTACTHHHRYPTAAT